MVSICHMEWKNRFKLITLLESILEKSQLVKLLLQHLLVMIIYFCYFIFTVPYDKPCTIFKRLSIYHYQPSFRQSENCLFQSDVT